MGPRVASLESQPCLPSNLKVKGGDHFARLLVTVVVLHADRWGQSSEAVHLCTRVLSSLVQEQKVPLVTLR